MCHKKVTKPFQSFVNTILHRMLYFNLVGANITRLRRRIRAMEIIRLKINLSRVYYLVYVRNIYYVRIQ